MIPMLTVIKIPPKHELGQPKSNDYCKKVSLFTPRLACQYSNYGKTERTTT